MRFFLCTAFLLSFVQAAFSQVDTKPVELESITRTVAQTAVVFDGVELSSESDVKSEKKTKSPAVLVTADQSATVAFAFDTEFNSAQVLPIAADANLNKRFLLLGNPGKYLLIVDFADKGSFVRPVVIAGEVQPDDPDPDDPEPPPTDFAELERAIETEVQRIAPGPQIGGAIAANFRTVAGKCESGEFDTVRAFSQSLARLNTATLGDSRPQWVQFGTITQAEFNKLGFETVKEYAPALRAVANAIERGAR